MDERKAVLKALKKECRQGKREHYTGRKTLAVLALVLALLCALWFAATQLREQKVVADVLDTVEDWLLQAESHWNLTGMASGFRSLLENEQLSLICGIAAAVCFCLFVLFAILWGRGRGRWKYSGAYLDYRTMQVTLKAERQAAKGK